MDFGSPRRRPLRIENDSSTFTRATHPLAHHQIKVCCKLDLCCFFPPSIFAKPCLAVVLAAGHLEFVETGVHEMLDVRRVCQCTYSEVSSCIRVNAIHIMPSSDSEVTLSRWCLAICEAKEMILHGIWLGESPLGCHAGWGSLQCSSVCCLCGTLETRFSSNKTAFGLLHKSLGQFPRAVDEIAVVAVGCCTLRFVSTCLCAVQALLHYWDPTIVCCSATVP